MASSAGVLVVGGYFVYLHDHGDRVNSLLLGSLSAIVYVTELLFAPLPDRSAIGAEGVASCWQGLFSLRLRYCSFHSDRPI